jgi:hypothetical protein
MSLTYIRRLAISNSLLVVYDCTKLPVCEGLNVYNGFWRKLICGYLLFAHGTRLKKHTVLETVCERVPHRTTLHSYDFINRM